MRIWIRVIVGTILGVVLGLVFPAEGGAAEGVFPFLSSLVIHIGRYLLFPFVFFSLGIGTYELIQERKLLRVYARTLIYMAIASLTLVVIGTFSVLFLAPERIPIIIEEEIVYSVIGAGDALFRIFPMNMFQVFTGDGDFLVPIWVLAFIIGIAFSYDTGISEPGLLLFDSLGRVLFLMNRFFMEIVALGVVVLSAYLLLQIRSVVELELFWHLLLILTIDAALVIFVIYPVLMYFLAGRENPYRWLLGILVPAFMGFFSGDGYFTLGGLMVHGKRNLGIPRSVGSSTFPVFLLFGRAGTAMVASISFIIILRSYSSLEITVAQVLWTIGTAFLFSFMLGSVPGRGVMVALYLLCTLNGRGLEEGFLILKPVAPLLISFSVLLDVVTASIGSYLVSYHEGEVKDVTVEDFI